MSTDTDLLADELRDWLPLQRWFAGKHRPVRAVRLLHRALLTGGDPQLWHVLAEVEHDDGGSDRYQLLLGIRREPPEHLMHAVIGSSPIAGAVGQVIYDAVHDQELTGRLLELIAAGAEHAGLSFTTMPGAELDVSLRARPVGAEQSNTSLVYGQRYILKLFRRIQPGLSPDLELHRALYEVGCGHIAEPLGWIDGELDGQLTTLAMLGHFLPTAADGWAMATASVRDLMAEADLHAHEVGGDFAGESRRLGHAVAAVHADLQRAFGHHEAAPAQLRAAAQRMHQRLDATLRMVPELGEHEPGLRDAFTALASDLADAGEVRVQRIHGDLHLGQALRTPTHWVLIDFEGEPATPLSRRREPATPLRDVAGMLRSFDYAAHQLLVGHSAGHGVPLDEHGERQLAFRAVEWSDRNRAAFCEGYAQVDADPREQSGLLRALELDKAVYEVGYEASHRPDWLPIPLASIARLLDGPA